MNLIIRDVTKEPFLINSQEEEINSETNNIKRYIEVCKLKYIAFLSMKNGKIRMIS
jgi:hypothetical protein